MMIDFNSPWAHWVQADGLEGAEVVGEVLAWAASCLALPFLKDRPVFSAVDTHWDLPGF
jgi:hypothetical protein